MYKLSVQIDGNLQKQHNGKTIPLKARNPTQGVWGSQNS